MEETLGDMVKTMKSCQYAVILFVSLLMLPPFLTQSFNARFSCSDCDEVAKHFYDNSLRKSSILYATCCRASVLSGGFC